MIARYLYNGVIHSFIAGISMHSDGTTGPPLQLWVRTGGSLFQPAKRLLLEYDGLDPERDVLMYRVIDEEEEM
jgi:hypothetical protein